MSSWSASAVGRRSTRRSRPPSSAAQPLASSHYLLGVERVRRAATDRRHPHHVGHRCRSHPHVHRQRRARSKDVDVGRRDAARRRHPRPDGNGDDARARHRGHRARRASCTRSRRAPGNGATRSRPRSRCMRCARASITSPQPSRDADRPRARVRRCRRRRCSPARRSTTAAPASPTRSATRSARCTTCRTGQRSPSGSTRLIEWNVRGAPDVVRASSASHSGAPSSDAARQSCATCSTATSLRTGRAASARRRVRCADDIAEMMVAPSRTSRCCATTAWCRTTPSGSSSPAETVDRWRVLRGAVVSVITRIEITHHQLPLDPPFPASWDPQPRTKFPATIVRVHDDEGHVGIGSGDSMHGFADYVGLLRRAGPARPRSPRRRARQHRVPRRSTVADGRRPLGPRRQDPRASRYGGSSAGAATASVRTRRAACTVRSTEMVEVARAGRRARLPGVEGALRATDARRRPRRRRAPCATRSATRSS